jgi:cathepsin H
MSKIESKQVSLQTTED